MQDSVLIVGGGISGLISAYSCMKQGLKVTLIEKSDRLGGMLQTTETEFGPVERAANGLLNSVEIEELLHDLKLNPIQPKPSSKKRYFLIGNKIRQIPISFFSIIRLIYGFLFINANPMEDESIRNWSIRIFGKEATSNLIEPALGGIYASELKDMDPKMAFSSFLWKNGDSVFTNLKNSRKKPKVKLKNKGTISFSKGISELTGALVESIKNKIKIHTNTEIISLDQLKKDYPDHRIIFCTNLQSTYRILNSTENHSHELRERNIGKIPLLSVSTITCFVKKPLLEKPGFGILFPKNRGIAANGVLLNDFIFDGRVFDKDIHSETWIYAGEFSDHLTEEAIVDLVKQDRMKINRSHEEQIISVYPKVWRQSFPVYGNELLRFNQYLDEIEKETLPSRSIRFLGNYRYGIGLKGLIESALKT